MSPSPFVAVVLAAGRGSRLGEPKALVDLAGETALSRWLRVLRTAGVGRVVVVLHPRSADTLRRVDLRGVLTVAQTREDADLTRSLAVAAVNLPHECEAFLVCPVDVALVEPDDVRALLRAWRDRAAGVRIVVPSRRGRRGHPALFDRALAAELLQLPEGTPAHDVVRRDPGRVLHVERDNEGLFRDLDTPEDLAWARARLQEAASKGATAAADESPKDTRTDPPRDRS